MKTYCKQCGFTCKLFRQTVERYPGQYVVAYVSECCQEEVTDWSGQAVPFGELHQQHEEQKSWEV